MEYNFTNIYNKVFKKLTSVRWLNKYSVSKVSIENYLKTPIFLSLLSDIVENKNFTSKATLNMLSPLIDLLLKDLNLELENDLKLKYIYNYVLNKNFPEATDIELSPDFDIVCELFLRCFRVICEAEKHSNSGDSFLTKHPLFFLSDDEEDALERGDEYLRFTRAFKNNYVYEMMKINGELTGFNTLEHICGVHSLSLFIGRQLKAKGFNIDLGRVSGSAAGHDIGKYGCRKSEMKRVPYLHYYYTDEWFKKHDINYIKNIALNHSTWDLEFENLSLENLILIYSDFRVKNDFKDGALFMNIFSLHNSFQVILDKLDNVDEAKEKRYKRVYAKLKDFEDYIISEGIITDICTLDYSAILPTTHTNFTLHHGNTIIDGLKYMSINHNINLMYALRDEISLDEILETARSEKDWKNLREYIRIFEEYSTYLTQKQKLQTIKFLFENLIHPEDDIRRHCAEIIGNLIAIYDEDYRKELPADVKINETKSHELFHDYITEMLFPSHKIISSHRYWLGYSLNIMVNSLFTNARENMKPVYRSILIKFYNPKFYKGSETLLFLLETAKYIPLAPEDNELFILYDFIYAMLRKRNISLRLSALDCSIDLCSSLTSDSPFVRALSFYIDDTLYKEFSPSENLLRYNLCKALDLKDSLTILGEICSKDKTKISEIYLANLKTATDWVKKRHQVNLLLHHAYNSRGTNAIHAAIHFCNLLKVSAVESVRHAAGKAILVIMEKLSTSERNEVAVELLRALEIEGHKFTEYIPKYLGQVFLYLSPKELDEIIDDLTYKIKISKSPVKTLILKTIGVTVEFYEGYKFRFEEDDEIFHKRKITLLGILLNGLGDYDPKVKQAAFASMGKGIFGSKNLSLETKKNTFYLIAKKLLTLIVEEDEQELLFLSNAAGLNHIYRFISDYTFFIGHIDLPVFEKVAFFPGTFDPFSLSHKEIAKRIRDLGYEVYLAVDEFSWSKKTLPNLLRRAILNMSIASELDIYIYPDSYPTNLSNKSDLKNLRYNFKNSEVYIVVGADVILNASSYKLPKGEGSVQSFSHIVFERNKTKDLKSAMRNITGNIVVLTLPSKYKDISSTQIRNYIDENRDISSLVDPLAQQYIYENGFYQREPLDKTTIQSSLLDVEVKNRLTSELLSNLCEIIDMDENNFKKELEYIFSKPSARVILLRDSLSSEIVGFSIFHWTRSSMLYDEINNVETAEYIRQNSLGRIIVLDGIFVKHYDKNKTLLPIILTETLAFCVSRDYEFALFKGGIGGLTPNAIDEYLTLYGFKNLCKTKNDAPIWVVNMSTPCILSLDIENLIKEPFRSNNKILSIINDSRSKLQSALCNLFPGELVLPFYSTMLHQGLIKKICKENDVPPIEIEPRNLGNAMCVPYGDLLDRYVIPNTITKSLHTEKYFYPNMKSFDIKESPHYLTLKNQIKMLKSFNRPVILVDYLLHKGYRMKALDPIFKEENIHVQKIITGILSGRGKDLMEYQGREVDSVYFIPRLKIWFNETALYPFIGGDSVWRGSFPERNLIPSVNLLLPYTSPNFIRGGKQETLYDLSKICIENSINILQTIEEEYHHINERNLNLSSLGEVFTIPRCVEHGRDVTYDLSLNASHYLKNDLETLIRFEDFLRR